ncbi:MAG: hypothetical protein IPH69_16445, partial [Bacteroidales bacterium]|nr:hypothetical protein [Bacteroidales bacterium]
VGSGGFYNPLVISGLPAVGGAVVRTISVGAVASNLNITSNSINKYWDLTAANITTLPAGVLSFGYNAGEVVGDALLFQPYTNTSGSWSVATGPSAPGANPATSTGSATITGQWTVGSPSTFYSYQTGLWNAATTWTFDPGGTTGPGTMVPGQNDKVVILSGRTVTLSGMFSTRLDITINNGGILDQAAFRFLQPLTALKGDGVLKLNSPDFPTVPVLTNTFVSTDGGTTEYTNIGLMSGAQSIYYHLNIRSSGIVTLTNNLTLNGDLNVKQGTFQINDAISRRLQILINGNVTVDNGGFITVGTGGTNGAVSPIGITGNNGAFLKYYDDQSHRIQIYGNFTNNGSVRFTNLAYPVYDELASDGFATVYFQGLSDNTLSCNGITDFYNLIVDKGTDQTFKLTVNSTAYSNFRLFGANTLRKHYFACCTCCESEP